MKGAKDPAIKLFGKEIALPENGRILAVSGEDDRDHGLKMSGFVEDEKVIRTGDEEEEQKEVEADDEDSTESKQEAKSPHSITEEPTNQETLPDSDDNPKTPSIDEENANAKTPKSETDQSDTNNNPQEKPLKKPDKILPCPRCNSMDTKFCYYNNYNVNQPRHFCKSCQRYWTAGGTMRNVPVGAGRRKNKSSSASNQRHITISEALQAAQIDAPNGIHYPSFRANGTVLSFGPEAPLCESVASVLNLAEKKSPNGIVNGFYKVSCNSGENGDDCSNRSSVTSTNSMEDGVRKNGLQEPKVMKNLNGLPSQIPCLAGVPWPYPWNSAVPVPAFCPPGFPMPYYPTPYWNCSVPSAWSVPWLSPPSVPSCAPHSAILGKHSRDGNLIRPSNPEGKESEEQKNSEKSILIPKTLRIDDPDEAARSSIWATLGIKNDSITRGGLFKAFQPKGGDKKNHMPETPPALQANPAAMSRSLSFQERT